LGSDGLFGEQIGKSEIPPTEKYIASTFELLREIWSKSVPDVIHFLICGKEHGELKYESLG
jgi:hypothetical protein